MRGLDQSYTGRRAIPPGLFSSSMSASDVMDGKVNNPMKSDVGRKSFVFVTNMTFPFDMAILNIKLKWKI